MGETTAIGWTDHTFNAWIGCTEAGPGCDLCYARELAARYQYGIPGPVAAENRKAGVNPLWGPGAPRYRTSPSNWKQPLRWNRAAEARERPAKVFCNSLSDVFDNEVEQSWRNDLFDLWAATPWLRWQIVTKRIGNVPKMLKDQLPPNCGLVVTTVDQTEFDRDHRKLIEVPAAWHGFSMEPQIGRILVPGDLLSRHDGSLWFITGGESRQQAAAPKPALAEPRPYDIMWAHSLIMMAGVQDDADADGQHLSVYVKQTGANPAGGADTIEPPRDGMGKDPAAWPAWMRVQNFPRELLV